MGEEQEGEYEEGNVPGFEISVERYVTDQRRSKDKTVNRLGKKLIELCQDFNLFILNGRGEGDREGEWTFVSERGTSVVDYSLVSGSIYH